MNSSTFIRHSLRTMTLTLALIAGMAARAQDVIHGTCQVSVTAMDGSKKFETVQYYVFKNRKQAENAKNILRKAATDMEQASSLGTEWDEAEKKLKMAWQLSRPNGQFKFDCFPGQTVLVHYFNDINHLVDYFEVKKGEDHYTLALKNDDKTIKEVNVQGENKFKGPKIKKVPGQDNGFEVSFNINLELPPGYTNENSRLIIQPLAIDCQTEDTVSYLTPLVYEGAKYHELQDKRMAFAYRYNDSLAKYYHHEPVLDGSTVVIDTQVVFRKPDKEKTYKGAYYALLEDYHHVYYNNGGEGTGSCLAFKPLKFLDFTMAAEDIPLTEEFKENAEQKARDVTRELNLKFITGKAELTTDSTNQEQFRKMINELKSRGQLLFSVQVTGTSSPEGSRERNIALARERTNLAARYLRDGVRGQDATVSTSSKVYTWNDVAAELNMRDTLKASMLGNLIAGLADPNTAYPQIKNLPFYDSDIEPILASMRRMTCSYKYTQQRILTPEEAIEEYFNHKREFVSGTKDDLSDGDFFNLFSAMTDSAEIDTLTMVAYRHMIKQEGYQSLKLSPYIANKMALLNIRRGMPNPEVLRPFIDWKLNVDQRRRIDAYTESVLNRHQILINQAIQYFQELKLDTAETLIDKVGARTTKSAELSKVLFFVRNLWLGLSGSLDGREMARFNESFSFVQNANKDNRAILFSELHKFLNKKRTDVEPVVDLMDDKSPKKWYLKGIIWSGEAGKEPKVSDGNEGGGPASNFQLKSEDELADLMVSDPKAYAEYNLYVQEHPEEIEALKNPKPTSPDDTISIKDIPHYLAYFQHAFDLEPKYKRLYFNEGNVDDDTRKKYKYKKKNIPAYRKLFRLLMEQRDAERMMEAGGNAGNGGAGSTDAAETEPKAAPETEKNAETENKNNEK